MDVHIGNVIGSVRSVDGDSLLAPKTLERIVVAVLAALDDQQRRAQRAQADTRVTQGVAAEQEDAQ